MSIQYDVIIIGAGAAGMMSAIEAGKRGRKVLLVDHYKKIGEKIRISGGGRCNFTNIHTNPNKFLSQNPKFVRSALSQFTQNDFINLINKYEIKFHEKKLGQLFCDHSAQEIVEMLLKECELANVTILKEFIVSLMMEPYGDLVEPLSAEMSIDEDEHFTITGSRKASEIKHIIENHYSWLIQVDFEKKQRHR